jgi:ATP-dependent RNA helicase DDX10/DBP4
MRSVHIQKDKTVFKLSELPAEEYAASMGLPGAPQIKLLDSKKAKVKGPAEPKVQAVVHEREVVGSDESDDEASEVEDEESEGESVEDSEQELAETDEDKSEESDDEDGSEDEEEDEESDEGPIKVCRPMSGWRCLHHSERHQFAQNTIECSSDVISRF